MPDRGAVAAVLVGGLDALADRGAQRRIPPSSSSPRAFRWLCAEHHDRIVLAQMLGFVLGR